MSENTLLQVQDLSVSVDEIEILKHVNLTVNKGEVHVLMGPNGAGKSTLGYALMGHPGYQVTSGKILLEGKDITKESADQRAKDGVFLTFQSPIEVPGITLSSFVRNACSEKAGNAIKMFDFRKNLKKTMELLSMDASYADRDLNVGFSGGEKKKAEILQMLMLEPKFCILDETDSGLDVDAVRTVSEGIAAYREKSDGGLLIITHSTKILESLSVDYTHVLVKGEIITDGDGALVDEINAKGFEQFLEEQA